MLATGMTEINVYVSGRYKLVVSSLHSRVHTRKPERTIKYVPAVLIIAIVSVGLEDFKHQVLQISVRWVFHGFDPESIVLGYKYMCMVHHFFSGL
jgi:hypothetical protein